MRKAKTKRKPKTVTKASASKISASKRSAAVPTANGTPLIVLGFDDQQKPRGARFDNATPDLVTKAADVMGLKVYRASAPDLVAIAQKLPIGRLYANGRGFVPNIRQSLYSDLIVELVADATQSLGGTAGDKDGLPAARGLPRSWDEIAPGHLVIAQEGLDYGWWEAIVL